VPGQTLSAALGVSTRSVRQYVHELNALAGGPMVQASHQGYLLDERLARRFASDRPDRRRAETPLQRLYYIARRLVTSTDGEDVFALAEMLAVSDATIEADLSKVRTMLREFDLTLRRDRTVVRIEGSEVDQRRLVRQILLDSAHGVAAAGLTAAMHEFHAYDLPGLTRLVEQCLVAEGIELHEYALGDLALHVVIALDRIATGHRHEAEPSGPADDPRVQRAVTALCDALEDRHDVVVDAGERTDLTRLVAARVGPHDAADGPAEDPYLALVRDVMRALSSQYLLDIDDDAFALNLSLHVRNLVARARSGQHARNPLRTSFKQSHPLVHELAVFVASQVEAGTGIEMDEDEIVFLSLHLGAYLQRTLEDADRVTVTCVVPRYYDVHRAFAERIAQHLGDTATVEDTITTLHHDWEQVTSDLIVSTIDLPATLRAEVVQVSPVPGRAELDRLSDVVRATRDRKSAARIRWTLSELFDPRLFRRVARTTQAEALETMCADLVAEGVARPTFLDDVRERERLSPTAFGGSIAVPHSLRMDCHRTAISILISDEPITWGESSVHLVALFALSPNGRHVFRDVLDQFIATLADPVRIAQIVADATSYERFVRAVVHGSPR
jgi:lichenan operon transcriptional antiterminator